MNQTALFDRTAKNYDKARRQLIPAFDDFYGTVPKLIPYDKNMAIHVLDLGAGTGLLTSFISNEFPYACFTLVDVAEQMLAIAKERFASDKERFDFLLLDYIDKPLPGEYNAIVSSLSIHHVTDTAKQDLFHRIYGALCRGGIFINADQVLGETPEISQQYYQDWLHNAKNQGVDANDLNEACERMKDDKMTTLETQMDWLRQLGFVNVTCWYKNYGFTVYSGSKP